MRAPKISLLITLFVTTVAIACSLPEQITPPPEGALETAVAATLTAIVPNGQPGEPGETEEPPQEQPEPPLVDDAPAVLRIVYTDGGNAWIIEGDSPPRQLSQTGDVETVLISDDGMKIVMILRNPDEAPEIRSINLDGSGELVLMTAADFDALYPLGEFVRNDYANITFIPGTHILMLNTRGVPFGPGLAKYDDLLRLNADTGELTTLFEPGLGGDFVLSPDGSQMALLKPTSIGLVQSDGSGLIPDVLLYDSIITYSEFQYYVEPVWSVDGTELMVAIPQADILAPGVTGEVWRIQAANGATQQIGVIEGDLYFPQFSQGAAIISPDFSSLSYAQKPAPDSTNLAFASVDGSGETIAAAGNFSWYGWSPDGAHYLIGQGSPFELAFGAGNQAPLVLGEGTNATWISSTEFLFLSGSFNNWTLNRGTIDGAVSPLVSPVGEFVNYAFDT